MSRPGSPDSEPLRLSAGGASDPALSRVGELVRDAAEPEPLPDAAVERVFRRLTRSPARFGSPKLRRLAVVLAVLGVATVAVGRFALTRTAPPAPPAPAIAPSVSVSVARPQPTARLPRAPLPPPPVEPVAPSVARAPSSTVLPPATPESRLAAESKVLEPAIAALRRERDPARALTLLGSYEAAFPHGVLSLEARVLRADALLALGRRSEALVLLDALPLDRVGRGVELRLVRAELRASGDCRSALPDFDRVLSGAPASGIEERALRGRSLCRASLGDAGGARSDAQRYLEKYPAGRFASELRAGAR
jgi:hypothetical protein